MTEIKTLLTSKNGVFRHSMKNEIKRKHDVVISHLTWGNTFSEYFNLELTKMVVFLQVVVKKMIICRFRYGWYIG